MTEYRKIILGLVVLLILSLIANAYLYGKTFSQKRLMDEMPYAIANVATSSSVSNGPGFKSEVITVYDGSRYRTYATSSPLSEQDVQKMQAEMQQQYDHMNELFKQQDELFRSLWNF